MFELLLWTTAGVVALGMLVALDRSRDLFHPLMFIGPMFGFLYAWMPSKLLAAHGLERYFSREQLLFLQTLYLLGVTAFIIACLSVGLRIGRRPRPRLEQELPRRFWLRFLAGGALAGSLGLLCWIITIVEVGGFVAAYSNSYSGGWDDSGYVRDGSLLLLVGVLFAVTSLSLRGPRLVSLVMLGVFGLPWLSTAILMARRGPTFALVVMLLMGFFLARRRRPPVWLVAGTAALLGWLVLFLVTNRQSIHLGADLSSVNTDVTEIVETSDTGNEYIYGGGSVLSAEQRDHYFWMRRYLAQVLVRPIPSAVWPNKYADFGVPELLVNAGTGEGFEDALGWQGADGSAPGIVADLWVELCWLAVPAMACLGWLYGAVWKRAVLRGGPWATQYVILSALSIYLVMQTMEAVIFRSILLSTPCWLVWRWARASLVLSSSRPRARRASRASSPFTTLPRRSHEHA
jgi:hypothetical protein